MASSKELCAALEAYCDGWRTGDKEAWLDLFAEDAVLIDPVGTPPHEGKAAVSAFWDQVRRMGMTMKPEIQRIAVCGTEALLLFRMNSLGASGAGMAVDVADIFSFDDAGKITSLKAYWDKRCMSQVKPA